MRAHQSNGVIKVTGIGRSNDVPNKIIPKDDVPGIIIEAGTSNTGNLLTVLNTSASFQDQVFAVDVNGQVEIPRGVSYGVRHLSSFYQLMGVGSSNQRIFGDLVSNTGKRYEIQTTTGDLRLMTNNANVIFRNGALNAETLRINPDGSLQPIGDDLLVSGGIVTSGISMTEGGSAVTGISSCPLPLPFWYGQTTADSTASRSYDWGAAATETEVVCSDHFDWDSNNSRLYVSSTGVYEVDVMFMVDGGSDFTANVIVKVDGTAKNTITHDYVSANSPSEYSGRWVGKVSAGSYISATFQDAANTVSTSHETGSTMIVKRLA
jgi:hypothetical protein